MNPDFLFEGEDKVVEVTTSRLPFRDFDEYRRERVEEFKKIGFDCFVIDEFKLQ